MLRQKQELRTYPSFFESTHMPSVRVNVSKFGKLLQLNDSATKFKSP